MSAIPSLGSLSVERSRVTRFRLIAWRGILWAPCTPCTVLSLSSPPSCRACLVQRPWPWARATYWPATELLGRRAHNPTGEDFERSNDMHRRRCPQGGNVSATLRWWLYDCTTSRSSQNLVFQEVRNYGCCGRSSAQHMQMMFTGRVTMHLWYTV